MLNCLTRQKVDPALFIDYNFVLLMGKHLVSKNDKKFIGFRGSNDDPSAIILKNNNLHIEIIINRLAFSAKGDPAGIADIIVEAAVTTICDHAASEASVHASDKGTG